MEFLDGGMTLRDYFAAKAMQAMLRADTDNGRIRDDQICDRTADLAYRMADAMLRRLSEQSIGDTPVSETRVLRSLPERREAAAIDALRAKLLPLRALCSDWRKVGELSGEVAADELEDNLDMIESQAGDQS